MEQSATLLKYMEKLLISDNWEIGFKDEFSSKKHWHEEIELAIMFYGRMEIFLNDEQNILEAGEMFSIGSGVTHYYIESQEEYKLGILKISLRLLEGLSQETKEFYKNFYQGAIHIKPSEDVISIFREAIKIMEKEGNTAIQESLVLACFMRLTAFIAEHRDLIDIRREHRQNSNAELLDSMQRYIAEHYNEIITLSDMSRHLGFSESYCSRYIKKKSGMNFLEYLNSYRVIKAKSLLSTTSRSITDIAYAVGFKSIQSFNRVFKQNNGITPREFRNNLNQ